MPTTPKEPRKQIKRIMSAATTTPSSALLVALDSRVTLLVIDFARVAVGEDLVGVADLDEFLFGRLVVWVFVWMVLFGEGAVGLFELFGGGGAVYVESLKGAWVSGWELMGYGCFSWLRGQCWR